MERVQKSIEVNRPLSQVYNQWTQFEEFPRFMEGVKQVKQADDIRLNWVAEVAGKEKQWTARIIDQIPDHRIAWESESGEYTAGVVNFQALAGDRTRVDLEMSYEPQGWWKTWEIRSALSQDVSRVTWSASKNLSRTAAKKPAPGAGRSETHIKHCRPVGHGVG